MDYSEIQEKVETQFNEEMSQLLEWRGRVQIL